MWRRRRCPSTRCTPAPTPTWSSARSSQVIEQQLTGIDNLMYFSSSSSNGGGSITLFFEIGNQP